MNLEEIKHHVELRNKKINVPFKEDSGFNYCKEFVEENKCNDIYDFADINIYDTITCLYYIRNKEKTNISEAISFVNSFKNCFNTLDFERMNNLWSDIEYVYKNYQLEPIIEYLEEKKHLKAGQMIKSFTFIEPDEKLSKEEASIINESQRNMLRNFRTLQTNCDIARIFREMNKTPQLVAQMLDMICVHKHINVTKQIYQKSRKEKDPNNIINKRKLKDYVKYKYNTKNILSIIAVIENYVTKQTYLKNDYIKLSEKETRNNEQSYDLLREAAKQEEITNARKIVKKIKDEELKHVFLKYIYEHNDKYYNQLEKKYNDIRKNTTSAYLEEMNKYGIVIDSNEIKKIMHNNLEDFREILSIIKSLSLEKNQIVKILKYTNLEIVNKIKRYINDGYLKIEYIINNIEIFAEDDNQLNIIEKNINKLSKSEINPKLFIEYPEILLCDDNQVIDNIDLLNKYGYKEDIKNSSNYKYLLMNHLEEKIDKYIELGYATFLEQDLSILNSDNIKRMELLNSMNIPISTIDELKQYLTTDKFIISDDNLDDYIPNVLDYKEQLSLSIENNELENYRIDKRTYSINGVLISSNKVEKLLKKGYSMYDALFYNMRLSEGDYERVQEKIKQYTI